MSAAAQRATFYSDIGPGQTTPVRPAVIVPARVVIRSAVSADATAVHRLVADHAFEGRLLPRPMADVAAHIGRFVVATVGTRVVGCADLAPLSRSVAEVRSLVVDSHARANGIGRQLLDRLLVNARAGGFETLCAFTHSPAYFVQGGFSIVPHAWIPEKIAQDCVRCPLVGRCGQYAVATSLEMGSRSLVGVGSVNE